MARKAASHDDSLKPTILSAAAKLLAERGGSNFTIRAVADAVGISAPSIYHHFNSRDALIAELVRHGLKTFAEHVGSTLDPADADPGDKIRACVAAHVRYEFEYADIARAFDQLLGASRTDPIGDALRREYADDNEMHHAFDEWDRFAGRLLAVIEEGIATGCFKVANAELATSAVISLADGVLLWVQPSRILTVERIAANYGDLALNLLCYQRKG